MSTPSSTPLTGHVENLPADQELEPGLRPPGALVRLLIILWPSFMMAAVMEMLVFAVIDPSEMRWFGGDLIGWSKETIYAVSFLIFWGVISAACALSALLSLSSDAPSDSLQERGIARHWP